jgi:hypothetical protein
MHIKEVITNSLKMSLGLLKTYLSDLSDQDIMKRPADSANHIAWQLGHIIASEQQLFSSVFPESYKALPEGFVAKHSKDTCANNNAKDFYTVKTYLEVMEQVRSDTIKVLSEIPDAKLDDLSPERLRRIAPKIADMFLFASAHYLMHSGQIAVLRRALGKPIMV